jgi:hypothetical protein
MGTGAQKTGPAGPCPAADARGPGSGPDNGEWLDRWLQQRTGPRESTIRGYAAHVRLYLRPCLGRILLADLTVQHVQAMFTAIARQREAEGRPVTAATLARVRATLRAALNAAIRAGLISANAASRAELPSARRPRPVVWTAARVAERERTGIRPPVAVWTPAQTAQFLNGIRGHRLYAAYHLIALRGLIIAAGCLVPGSTRPRQPEPPDRGGGNREPAAAPTRDAR